MKQFKGDVRENRKTLKSNGRYYRFTVRNSDAQAEYAKSCLLSCREI